MADPAGKVNAATTVPERYFCEKCNISPQPASGGRNNNAS
jgi:nitrate reductase cytochrome c-type subunit